MHERTGSLSTTGRSSCSDSTAAVARASVSALAGDSPTGRLATASIEAGSVPVSVKPSPAASISISRTWMVSSMRR